MTDLGLKYGLGGIDAVTFIFIPDFGGASSIPRTSEFIFLVARKGSLEFFLNSRFVST